MAAGIDGVARAERNGGQDRAEQGRADDMLVTACGRAEQAAMEADGVGTPGRLDI